MLGKCVLAAGAASLAVISATHPAYAQPAPPGVNPSTDSYAYGYIGFDVDTCSAIGGGQSGVGGQYIVASRTRIVEFPAKDPNTNQGDVRIGIIHRAANGAVRAASFYGDARSGYREAAYLSDGNAAAPSESYGPPGANPAWIVLGYQWRSICNSCIIDGCGSGSPVEVEFDWNDGPNEVHRTVNGPPSGLKHIWHGVFGVGGNYGGASPPPNEYKVRLMDNKYYAPSNDLTECGSVCHILAGQNCAQQGGTCKGLGDMPTDWGVYWGLQAWSQLNDHFIYYEMGSGQTRLPESGDREFTVCTGEFPGSPCGPWDPPQCDSNSDRGNMYVHRNKVFACYRITTYNCDRASCIAQGGDPDDPLNWAHLDGCCYEPNQCSQLVYGVQGILATLRTNTPHCGDDAEIRLQDGTSLTTWKDNDRGGPPDPDVYDPYYRWSWWVDMLNQGAPDPDTYTWIWYDGGHDCCTGGFGPPP